MRKIILFLTFISLSTLVYSQQVQLPQGLRYKTGDILIARVSTAGETKIQLGIRSINHDPNLTEGEQTLINLEPEPFLDKPKRNFSIDYSFKVPSSFGDLSGGKLKGKYKIVAYIDDGSTGKFAESKIFTIN